MLKIKKQLNFLITEDDQLSRLTLSNMLKNYGQVFEATNAKAALELIADGQFDMAFIDLDLEDGDLKGLEIIGPASKKGIYPVVLSGREEESCIEEAYLKGCQDYLVKPFDKSSLEMVLKKFSLLQGKGILKKVLATNYITQDESLIKELEIINEIVLNDKPVLIFGPTGTGKSHIAKTIHEIIHGNDNKFISLNCSEIPENLLESELFGYEKGAFSGAEKSKKGKLELADGGTLFLDEIATMPALLQKKLLKAIEEKTFYPLGSEKSVKSNFRLVSATCENLKELVANGEFREDLYFRIEGYNINLKSLKERTGDIGLLIKHFMAKSVRRIVIPKEVMTVLETYMWPGNIRELRKCVEMLITKTSGIISTEDLPENIAKGSHPCESSSKTGTLKADGKFVSSAQIDFIATNGLKAFIEKIEDEMVGHFYTKNSEKVRQTLLELKISNSSFYRIMDRLKSESGSLRQ
ncbi:MAG: sigma-54-dependent Fis family transcriptional regulator [Bacteriovoracaceae bacterium]|nr:sigma-54-dependent Fis family transcriptional regulator [Bacteriovoracaceae bacterium]